MPLTLTSTGVVLAVFVLIDCSSAGTGYPVPMLLSPRHFVAFLDGRLEEVQKIAFVPGAYGAHIRSLSPNLLIERQYALKLQKKHNLRYEQFRQIQPTIDNGYVGIHRGDLLFLFWCEEQRRWFLLAVKTAAHGSELWLKTFYRPNARRVAAILKRMMLLREHA